MTKAQEHAITLSLNVLHVGFFECPKQYYEHLLNNDEWALLMTAANVNDVGTLPQAIALAVLQNAVAREGFFSEMADFRPPLHYCSFLTDKLRTGERTSPPQAAPPGQPACPFATFESLKVSDAGALPCPIPKDGLAGAAAGGG